MATNTGPVPIAGRQMTPNEEVADQLRECAKFVVDGSSLYCEAPIMLMERAANLLVAAEVRESYRRRWTSHTVDGAGWAEAAFEPAIVWHAQSPSKSGLILHGL